MKRTLMTLTTAVLMIGTAMAQNPDRILDRKQDQQGRIANGVKSGQLTARETAHLEHREVKLNRQIRHERAQNGGNLTNNEKRQINQRQNRISNSIYRQKHDAQTAPR